MRTIALALISLAAGCINEFQGSNVQIDMATPTPAQASPGLAPTADELPNNIHFTLYAFNERVNENMVTVGSLFEVQRFEVHHIVDLNSPCYIDVGDTDKNVPFPGLHVSQFYDQMKIKTGIDDYRNPPPGASQNDQIDVATAFTRQDKINKLAAGTGPKVLTLGSTGGYGPVGTTCTDMSGIPPANCVDPDSNARRLAMCQTAWKNDEFLYEGTDRVLTAPLNGKTQGFVTGENPVNFAPIGGAQFFVDSTLEDFDGYAIYWQYDDANHDGMPDYPASVPLAERNELGVLILFGRPESPTRGVIHARMTSLVFPSVTADLAIFPNLAKDDVQF